MGFNFAVSGKGGTGKTTIASLIISSLMNDGGKPVLAIDADPNSNLNVNLGMDYDRTIADIRENIEEKDVPEGMTKISYVALKMEEALIEGEGLDMLVMGRPEGQGCYCAANHMLKDYISKLGKRYSYTVMDNEAGMEHLSRRTTDDIDALLAVCEPTMVSVRSAVNVMETAKQIKLNIKNIYAVINKFDAERSDNSGRLEDELEENSFKQIFKVPLDEALLKASEEGKDVLSFSDDSPAVGAVKEMMEVIIG